MYDVCDVDLFDVVENDICEFDNKGVVYLLGDWNSRVCLKNDFIVCGRFNDQLDNGYYLPNVPTARASFNKTYNSFS